TMTTYQAVASTAVAATPPTDPAPQIQKSNAQTQSSSQPTLSADNPLGLPDWLRQFLDQLGIGNSPVAHAPTLDYFFDDWIATFLKNFGINWNPSAGTVNGLTYDAYADPSVGMYWVARGLELFEDVQQFATYLVQNPVLAFQYLFSWALYDFPLHILQVGIFLTQSPALLAPVAGAVIAPVGAAGGLAGLAGLAGLPQPAVVPALAPAAAAPPVVPLVGPTPFAAPAAAPATAPAPAPTTTTVASSPPAPPPPAPPAASGPGFGPPYVVGPGIGASSGMGSSASSRAKKKTPEQDAAVAAGVAAARDQAQAQRRQRRRAKQRGYGDEYANMDIDVDPDWGGPPGEEPVASTVASDRGAGTLGFAGTVSKDSGQAAGLTTLAGDEFGGGPTMPMLPGSWNPDQAGEAKEGGKHD
ncbi:MAG TPA: hypothetical protein VHY57_01585, partial [Rhizomicrobium sp.]|nr:hypothetical protein [Rhizomicrobium sp.]